jgi:heme oxygenase
MSLKDLTAEKHDLAENTAFMKAVFAKQMPLGAWADFTYQKHVIYELLELKADHYELLEDVQGIKKSPELKADALAMNPNSPKLRHAVSSYYDYLTRLSEPKKIMAHVYVWHMGDLFGGQMIKQMVDAPHTALDFENPNDLKAAIRSKLSDDMADEANLAFDWAIKILKSYDSELAV